MTKAQVLKQVYQLATKYAKVSTKVADMLTSASSERELAILQVLLHSVMDARNDMEAVYENIEKL